MDLARMRLEYEAAGLDGAELDADPLTQFAAWIQVAVEAELDEPNAMVVSTVDGDGQPWSRYLLLKRASAQGFDFYTNYESHKSQQLQGQPRAAATFGWLALRRQVNVAGVVERIADAESDEYWAVRPRGSQIGAWTSNQSRAVADRQELLDRYDEVSRRYPDEVPRPPHWGGWRIVPHAVEFWQGRENRLHDRLRYTRDGAGRWDLARLAP